jgi:hypothetical protein
MAIVIFDWIIMTHRSPNSLTTMIFNAQFALRIHRKALAAGALPRIPLEELTTLPQTSQLYTGALLQTPLRGWG